ncbi:MAG: hypothetical protein ACLGI2_11775 [Acidimicrobiia bacterium]
MFKRLFWLTVGTVVGFGGSVWAQRRIREKIERYYPEQVARQVGTSVRSLSSDLRSAAAGGKAAMREREDSLRDQFRPPSR